MRREGVLMRSYEVARIEGLCSVALVIKCFRISRLIIYIDLRRDGFKIRLRAKLTQTLPLLVPYRFSDQPTIMPCSDSV